MVMVLELEVVEYPNRLQEVINEWNYLLEDPMYLKKTTILVQKMGKDHKSTKSTRVNVD